MISYIYARFDSNIKFAMLISFLLSFYCESNSILLLEERAQALNLARWIYLYHQFSDFIFVKKVENLCYEISWLAYVYSQLLIIHPYLLWKAHSFYRRKPWVTAKSLEIFAQFLHCHKYVSLSIGFINIITIHVISKKEKKSC
jgi:hypothetical protein